MTRYLLSLDYHPGVIESPMDEWKPEDIAAHMEYYRVQMQEIRDSGELVGDEALTGPDYAKIVVSDGSSSVITDGPFAEFKEMLAGFQMVDVESEERALEIAARISAVPGPGGVPSSSRSTVRRVMDASDFEALTSS